MLHVAIVPPEYLEHLIAPLKEVLPNLEGLDVMNSVHGSSTLYWAVYNAVAIAPNSTIRKREEIQSVDIDVMIA